MPDSAAMRILDASLNRAGEGLRVVEDFVRFVLGDPFLTAQAKALRHDLAATAADIPPSERHAARETLGDVGTAVTTPAEALRDDTWSVCAASLKRTEQSFRSLEEYGKLVDSGFSRRIESLRYRLYTLEKIIDITRCSQEKLASVRLCVLIDACDSMRSYEKLIHDLIGAGVGMIQLRNKTLDDRQLLGRARQLRHLTRGTPTLCIINDRADIAAAVHADGVHLGQEDLPVKDARSVVGTRMLVGVSTHNISQARAAVLDGADYLGAGPTFPSQTKSFDQFAGLDYLRELAAETHLPTFAIGGITVNNLAGVLETGIDRIAVSATVTSASEPASAARELLAMLNRGARHTSPGRRSGLAL